MSPVSGLTEKRNSRDIIGTAFFLCVLSMFFHSAGKA